MLLDVKDHIVEFLAEGRVLFGLVTSQSMDKLQVTDANGRNRRVAARSVLIVHPGRVVPAEFNADLESLRSDIRQRREEVDTELLWEATAGRSSALDPGFLAREYFGEDDSRSRSAVLRAALDDPVRFRFKGVELYSRSREQVDQQLHQRQVERERQERWEAVSSWLKRALEGSSAITDGHDFSDLLDEVQHFLFSRNVEPPPWLSEEDPEIWKRTPILHELTPREAAFQLLVGSGRLPRDADPLLVIAGIEPSFTVPAQQEVSEMTAYIGDPSRVDFTPLDPVAIDDEDTVEVDDALTVERISNGWRVGIHISDVAHFVKPGGVLLEEACNRVSSLYLPHRALTMLPDRLSCDLASLNQGELRPVVSTLIEVNETGEIVDFQICRGQLRVKQRLTYDEVDLRLRDESDPVLSRLSWFAGLRSKVRASQGAVTFQTPEFKIRVDPEERISVTRIDPQSAARQLVAEMMILANSLAPRFAQESGRHIVYRAQRPPKKELKIPAEYDPVALMEVFRGLERSRYVLDPEPHAGLGLQAYAQITSPLRRLADLLSQIQLSAHLRDEPPVFTAEDLTRMIQKLGDTERNLRAVERRAIRYYLLKHIDRECRGQAFEAIVLGPADRGFEVETIQFAVRGRLLSGSIRRKPGERVEVKVDEIDPEQGHVVFRERVSQAVHSR